MVNVRQAAVVVAVGAGGLCVAAFGQTASDLITRFSTLLGANKYAKLVWQEEACDTRKPNFDVQGWCGGTTKLMVMDTKDGAVRQLVADSSGSHWSAASFTFDGTRIVYTDNTRKKIRIVNWDGTGKRILLNGYDGDGHCYRSTDDKDWALASQFVSTANAKFIRVNVDDTTEKVTLKTCTWNNVGWAGATCWASMSTDGKYVAAGFPNYGNLGVLTVSSGNIFKFDTNGCWSNMAFDTTGDVAYCNDGGNAHREIKIVSRTGVRKNLINLTTGSNPPVPSNQYYESLRWTRDRDYFTMWVYSGSFVGSGKANPRLVRVSDLKWAAVRDNPTVAIGNMDVYFYSGTPVIDKKSSLTPAGLRAQVLASTHRTYDVRGRAVQGSMGDLAGVHIVATLGERSRAVRSISLQ